MRKIIIMPCLLIENNKIISKSSIEDVEDKGDILETARYYSDNSADELMFINKTENDLEKDKLIRIIKDVTGRIEIPLLVYIHVKKFEDAKKAFYAGANKVMFDEKHSGQDVAAEIIKRFGEERVIINKGNNLTINETIPDNLEDIFNLISEKDDTDIYLTAYDFGNVNIMELKYFLKQKGLQIDIFESKLEFSDFKLNKDGMLPVITQDYKTNEVLQLAYMTEEAFNNTLKSGKMTYYSRSRSELWVKGETSGHFQYVKSLTADCDKDTLLAKVSQVGAACHTGEKSCFFNTIAKKDYTVSNPLKVFEDEYKIIIDRKQNPKEGSYTTYLFKKGLDKILKKLGEEATEIVIAAKNNNTEELKYEIADFLYHMTVLMVDKGLDWKDITDELIDRR